MATSLQKIAAFERELVAPPGEDPDPVELGMRSLVQLGAPLLRQILPDDPAVMDEHLTLLAGKLLAMRSDEAPELQIAPAHAGLLQATTD